MSKELLTIACLFNSDHKDFKYSYGFSCTKRVIRALERLREPAFTQVLIGDVLAHRLAEDLSAVSANISKKGHSSTSRTYNFNKDRYKLLVCDLAESLSGFIKIDTSKLLHHLLKHTIWTVVLTGITRNQANELNERLKSFEPYLGIGQIDPGNPIHLKLFNFYLIKGAFFKGGRLFYCRGLERDENEDMGLAKTYGSSASPILLDYENFEAEKPPFMPSETISVRGKLSLDRFESKSRLTHKQRVARALLEYFDSNPDVTNIEFSADTNKDSIEFFCEEGKIKNYLLNKNHKKGGAKAKFFVDVLDIEQEDWRYLADQIVQGMKNSELYRVKNTGHGISHGALIKITGRNGRSVIIETGWEIKKGERARLVTAYPRENVENKELFLNSNRTNVVLPSLKGNDRWSSIFRIAHEAGQEAARNCIPIPLIIEGYSPIFDGECGSAWVSISDARTGMARWLKKNKIGHNDYRSGWRINPKLNGRDFEYGATQSIEIEKAYAKAFADVLMTNGVKCKVESRLD